MATVLNPFNPWQLAQVPAPERSPSGEFRPTNIPMRTALRSPPADNGSIPIIDTAAGTILGHVGVAREEMPATIMPTDHIDTFLQESQPVSSPLQSPVAHVPNTVAQVITAPPTRPKLLAAFAPKVAAAVQVAAPAERPPVRVLFESATDGQETGEQYADVWVENGFLVFAATNANAFFVPAETMFAAQIEGQPTIYLVVGTPVRFSYFGVEFGLAVIEKTTEKPAGE